MWSVFVWILVIHSLIALILDWIRVFLFDFRVYITLFMILWSFCLAYVVFVFPACILMIYCLIVLIFNRICVILCDSKMLHSLVIVDLPIPSWLVPLKQYWSCWFFIKLSLWYFENLGILFLTVLFIYLLKSGDFFHNGSVSC